MGRVPLDPQEVAMICQPWRPVHSPADCIDVKAGREYPWWHCVCQGTHLCAAQ